MLMWFVGRQNLEKKTAEKIDRIEPCKSYN